MYVVYRLYDFFSKKDTTPIGDTVIVMSVIHFLQVFTLFLYINIFFDLRVQFIPKNLNFYLIVFFIYILYYFFVFHNGKWKEWANQFKEETSQERKRNGIKVWLFCWGSIILFFISLPLIAFLK
jgi:hypothetical protein